MINEMKQKMPLVNFDIRNYYKNSKGHKVTTHAATEPYRYFEWMDQTADSSALNYLKFFKCTRLHYKIDVDYTAQSKASFNYQEWDFKRANIRNNQYDYDV